MLGQAKREQGPWRGAHRTGGTDKPRENREPVLLSWNRDQGWTANVFRVMRTSQKGTKKTWIIDCSLQGWRLGGPGSGLWCPHGSRELTRSMRHDKSKFPRSRIHRSRRTSSGLCLGFSDDSGAHALH